MSAQRTHQELVVITKTYALILWSCHHTSKFPPDHRFVLDERIESHLSELLESLIQAKYTRQRHAWLEEGSKAPPGRLFFRTARKLG